MSERRTPVAASDSDSDSNLSPSSRGLVHQRKRKREVIRKASEILASQPQMEDIKLRLEDGIRQLLSQVTHEFTSISSDELLLSMTGALENLAQLTRREERKSNKPVRVYLDGCFDIMHSGHYNAIRQAKSLGDVLVVGVHSDAEILKHKGPPVMNENERLKVVRACKWVDEVVFDTPYDPSVELLDKLNCDFVVHGDDISTSADGTDAYAVCKRAGRMKVIKRTEGVSTTDLVGRILCMTTRHHQPSEDTALDGAEQKQLAQQHYTQGISSFLPTSWRISQFSNHKTPSSNDVVVYIDGDFDLFHVGHIETLKQAKELGTFLLVGVHDDETVNEHKGSNFPIMNLHERVLNVLSCKYVDEVVIGAPWAISRDMINSMNINKVVMGWNTKFDKNFSPGTEEDPYAVAKQQGVFVELPPQPDAITTLDVVERILENRLRYEKRNEKRATKELNYIDTRQFITEL